MPSWATEVMGSTELQDLREEIEKLKKENIELEKKLLKAEERQDQLNSMLHNAIRKLTQ
jgi:predicted  nucleic acid-binding Zn-ribbon protein